MQEEAANSWNRSTTANDGDSGREQVCVCFSTHTLWYFYAAGEWRTHYWSLSVSSLRCVAPVAVFRQSCAGLSLPAGLMGLMTRQ